jgi:predicted transcriptional regulator
MAESTILTLRLDAKLRGSLDRLAKATKRSRSFLAAEAIRDYVAPNNWQIAGIQKGIAEADRDAFASQAQVARLAGKPCLWTAKPLVAGLLAAYPNHRFVLLRPVPVQYGPPPFLTFYGCKTSRFSRPSSRPLIRPRSPRHTLWFAPLAVQVSQCAPQSWLGSGQKESAGEEALRR